MEQEQINSSYEENTNEKIREIKEISSVGSLLKKSLRIFKQESSKFLTMTLFVPLLGAMPLIIVIIFYLFFFSLSTNLVSHITLSLLILVSTIILFCVSYISKIGIYILFRDFSPDLTVKEAFKRAIPYFGNFFIVKFFVIINIVFWSLLFVVPGIIVFIYYSFAIWVLIFEDYKGMLALKRSKELVKGHWWAVFLRFLAISLIYLIVVIIFNRLSVFFGLELVINLIIWIIQIIMSVIIIIYNYLIYEDLVRINNAKN